MLLTRKTREQIYSELISEDGPMTTGLYFQKYIQKYIEICGGNAHVKDFMFGKVY